MVDAAQFYTNRVLKEYKEKYNHATIFQLAFWYSQDDPFCRDKMHVDWVKAWIQVLNDLHAYVKQNHTTGLTWNSAPVNLDEGHST